ncbi:cadherin-23-like [Neocloeon triangulifer]|uniref:cadherin-23-like n=1 Tax=Neocloeon triangulifer TaxID=2078957 RepID=UPI00286EDA7A|nr:cadherin-23-like [Neocloeon triangulifer]
MASLAQLAVLLMVFSMGRRCQAQWNQPYFEQPADTSGNVVLQGSDRAYTSQFDENVADLATVAIINYSGATKPTYIEAISGCGSFGLDFVQESSLQNKWAIKVSQPQDFENSPACRIEVRVQGSTIVGVLTLQVRNLNDNNPFFELSDVSCPAVKEDASGDTECKFTLKDFDGLLPNSASITVQPAGLFAMTAPVQGSDQITIVSTLRITGELDYETAQVHMLTLTGSDGERTITTNVILRVDDVADTAPIWLVGPQPTVRFNEETQQSFTYTARDGDAGATAQNLKFTLVEGDSRFFTLTSPNVNTCKLDISAIDSDTQGSDFTVIIRAEEENDSASFIEQEMQVIVNDVNDNTPSITPSTLTATIDENFMGDINFGEIKVVDPDLGASGQYRVELVDESENNWKSAFAVIPNSGYQETIFSITVLGVIDYEDPIWRNIALKLRVTETGDPSHTAEVPITITVQNLNDETPVFSQSEYTASVDETATAGTSILKIEAIDNDPGDTVTYQFSTTSTAVSIDATGLITVAKNNPFDFEFQNEVILQVVATDTATPPHRSTAQVLLTIIDKNDSPPTISVANEEIRVAENAATGTEISRSITAEDLDSDAELEFQINWDLTYATNKGVRVQDPLKYKDCLSIETEYVAENKGNAIAVLKAGTVFFDWEAFDALYLKLAVEDIMQENNGRREITVVINVDNENDNPPVFDPVTIEDKSVREASSDQLIGFVVATDPDQMDLVTYEIQPVGDSPAEWVTINGQTGEIRTSTNSENLINADGDDGFQVLQYKVIAKDSNADVPTEVTITINVLDTNDNTPVLNVPQTPVQIMENSPGGTEIATVTATDLDFSEPFGKKLQYFINTAFPEQANYFEVDATTGVVSVKEGADLDRDGPLGDTYRIELIVMDNSPPTAGVEPTRNTGTAGFNVILLDENDESPQFEEPTRVIEVNEDVESDSMVYEGISAPDADAPGPFSNVTYEIVSSTPPGEDLFTLENINNKANIKTAKILKGLYGTKILRIKATDGGGINSDEKDFEINVLDVNDNSPQFTWPPQDGYPIRISLEQNVSLPLRGEDGRDLTPISGTDADSPETGNGRFDFTIKGDATALRYLDISSTVNNQASLLCKEKFPSEGLLTFSLTLVARDQAQSNSLETERQVQVFIITTTDVVPIFEDVSDPQIEWEENDPAVSAELPLAKDLNNENQEQSNWQPIYYYIFDGDAQRVFKITNVLENNVVTPIIGLSDPEGLGLDSDDGPKQYILTVIASNSPFQPPLLIGDERQVITVTINVIDLPDSSPVFAEDLYVGGIAPTDVIGVEIIRITASDSDVGDTLTYKIIPGTMSASESYLVEVMDNAFDLDPNTGYLKTKFAPQDYMKGYFTFDVEAKDSVNNVATTKVKIYIINDSNRVKFFFLNEVPDVDSQRDFIADVFTRNLGDKCAIDYVTQSTEGRADTVTMVRTHFIDQNANLPVEGGVIEARANNPQTLTRMRAELVPVNLNLLDVTSSGILPEDNLAAVLTTTLIVVGVVLGSLVALLLVAFVVKTRSLNRRLEALSTTKFGSQESGLNRIAMNVPNTNKHAIEGSNPVWNEEMPSYDNQSQHSGDSELIGIEDKPDFAYENQNFQSNFYGQDETLPPPYQTSNNPDVPSTYL